MNGILGMLTLLERTTLTPVQQDYTLKAQGATKALLGILNDILDFSKVEAGKLELDPGNVVLGEVMRDLQTILEANLPDPSVALSCTVDADAPAAVVTDALRLRQVLLNLAGNAIKFTSTGHVRVSARTVNCAANRVQMEFSVEDSGIGIPADKLDYIFEGFSQAESSTTRKFGGSGLGLAISKRLVELMGGNLQVHSELGQGSRFFFTLEMDVGTAQAPAPRHQPAVGLVTGDMPLEGLRLLVVEDNLLNQQVARELLTRSGAQVTVAGGGVEGVTQALAATPPFDAVLMDLQMPDIDGYEATRRIRSHAAMHTRPIIAMTANALASDREACLAAGMVDHISKPINLDELIATLLHHTGRSTVTAPGPGLPQPATKPAPAITSPAPVEGLDYRNALLRLGGDSAFYTQIAQQFLSDSKGMWSEFQQALDQNNTADARRCAHTIKGLAGTLGSVQLAAKSAQVEAGLKNGTKPDAQSLSAMEAALRLSLEQLRDLVSQLTKKTEQPARRNTLSAQEAAKLRVDLIDLLDLLQNNNMRSTSVCKALREHYGNALGEPFDALELSIGQLNFMEAMAHTRTLLDDLASSDVGTA
jgi:CheY-like chemotaxis protein